MTGSNKLSQGKVIAGKYELERPLAAGGMGSVWVARHLGLDIRVAIKFMGAALALSADARSRFEREAKASAQLKSAHVVAMLDHGVDDETPYIVMELLEGEDLGARLKRVHRLSLQRASALLQQIATGLKRAHEAGIIHRDLKPANVFLARVDDVEVAKIVDFGLAKTQFGGSGDGATRTGAIMGSPNYMSPEQARGLRDIDHRTDLWSLALIIFRAITGKMAFSGESDGDVIVKVCTDPIPRPSDVAPDLPAALDPFFDRALSRDRGERFASAAEMASVFAELVAAIEQEAKDAAAFAPSPRDVVADPAPPAPVLRSEVTELFEAPPGWEPKAHEPGEKTLPLAALGLDPAPRQAAKEPAAPSPALRAAVPSAPPPRRSSLAVPIALGALVGLVAIAAFGLGLGESREAPPTEAKVEATQPEPLTVPVATQPPTEVVAPSPPPEEAPAELANEPAPRPVALPKAPPRPAPEPSAAPTEQPAPPEKPAPKPPPKPAPMFGSRN